MLSSSIVRTISLMYVLINSSRVSNAQVLTNYFFYTDDQVQFGCKKDACSVTKTFEVWPSCVNPQLRLQVIQTDMGSVEDPLAIYVNDDLIGYCHELSYGQECSLDWIECENFESYFNDIAYIYDSWRLLFRLVRSYY